MAKFNLALSDRWDTLRQWRDRLPNARLRRLEDIEAIKQLKHRYFIACDGKDAEGFKQCFVEGAGQVQIAFGRIGDFNDRDALTATFSKLACEDHIVEMHHAQNPVIELLSDDAAQARWGLYYFMINTQERSCTQLGGHYNDRYVKRDGRWLISASEFVATSTYLSSVADDVCRPLFVGAAAPTAIDDPARQASPKPAPDEPPSAPADAQAEEPTGRNGPAAAP